MRKIGLLASIMIVSICSFAQTKSISVTVSEPGTLSMVVASKRVAIPEIKSLKVKGPINGDDIVFIRYLAGVISKAEITSYYYDLERFTEGRLEILDLSDAEIVSGGSSYQNFYGSGVNVVRNAPESIFNTDMLYDCYYLKEVYLPSNTIQVNSGNGCGQMESTPNWHICNPTYGIDSETLRKSDLENIYFYNGPVDIDYYISDQVSIYVPKGNLEQYKNSCWKTATIKELTEDMSFISFTSSNHDDNSTAIQSEHIFIPKGAKLSFDYGVSSEQDCDYLKVTLNGKTLVNKSGSETGTYSGTFSNDLDGTLVISYTKDEFSSDGEDYGYVKNIKLSISLGEGNNTYYTPLEPEQLKIYDDTEVQISERCTASTLKYIRTFNNTNWQSLYVPFSMSYDAWKEDFDIARINNAHQYDDNDDGVIDRTELEVVKVKSGSIDANTPYVIRAKSIGEKTLTVSNAKVDRTEEQDFDLTSWNTQYKFYGTYSTIPGQTMLDNGYYAMGGGALVQAQDANSDLGAFRWYMSVTDRDGNKKDLYEVKMMIRCLDDDEDETAISNFEENSNESGSVYDLSGRRMNAANGFKSGIYIKNGKKYAIK